MKKNLFLKIWANEIDLNFVFLLAEKIVMKLFLLTQSSIQDKLKEQVEDILGNPIILGCTVALCTMNYHHAELKWGIASDFEEKDKEIIVRGGTCKRAIKRSGKQLIVILMPVER